MTLDCSSDAFRLWPFFSHLYLVVIIYSGEQTLLHYFVLCLSESLVDKFWGFFSTVASISNAF